MEQTNIPTDVTLEWSLSHEPPPFPLGAFVLLMAETAVTMKDSILEVRLFGLLFFCEWALLTCH